MTTDVTPADPAREQADTHAMIEQALTAWDVSKMDAATRVRFYRELCARTGLEELTRPFILMKNQSNELHFYPTVGAAEQLRQRHHVSIKVLSREHTDDGLYTVTVVASTPDGRSEDAQGIVALVTDRGPLKYQELANAKMKAESKAKRRATFALCGLGLPGGDEDSSTVVPYDVQTGAVARPETDAGPPLLTSIGIWFRQQPKAVREPIAQAVWGCALPEIPHLGQADLAAGWHVIDQGRAPLAWDSPTLADDLRQWRAQHAEETVWELFDRSEGKPEEGA